MNSSYLYRFIVVALLGVISWSCTPTEGEYKGMEYFVRERGSGATLDDSSIVQVQMRVFNSADSLLQETYGNEFPALLNLRDSNNRKMPLVEILSRGKVGDSVTIFTQSDSIYQGQNAMQRPPFIPVGSKLRQEFRLVKAVTFAEFAEMQEKMRIKQEEAMAEQQKAQQEYYAEMAKQQMEMEKQADSVSKIQVEYIKNTYFKQKGIKNFKKTESGLYYKIDKQGKTDIKAGDQVKVHYEGTLLESGEKFDASRDHEGGNPIEFPIGQGQVIKGWDEGIPLIGRGGTGYLYIPSNLGYGARGSQGGIPPNAMLVFKVEVMEDIKKAEAQEGQNLQGGGN